MGKMHDALRKAEPARPELQAANASNDGAVATAPVETSSSNATATAMTLRQSFFGGDVDGHVVMLSDPRSPLAEQYRTLRTNILALSQEQELQSIVVTSAVPSEGKTISSVNLAVAMAEESDRRVVLVDADMRKPNVHRMLGIDNQHGLSEYLSGTTMLEMVLQRARLPNLWVLPAGRVPGNPADLLGGKRMEDLLQRLRREFDFVVIDTPPVVSTTDSGVISPRVDGTVLVVRMGKTPREVSRHALEQLRKARAKILGLVLTGMEGQVKDYYYAQHQRAE